MPINNCGLKALDGVVKVKNISMFTLIHLARENGINFYFCKVDSSNVALVTRPAILHQDDHFVLAEDSKPLPQGQYTGWVLTTKPMGTPLPFSLAKQIVGAKKGGDILGPIVTGLASIVNPWLGAAVGAGFQIHKTTGGAGVTPAKGEFWRIPIGGALGYLGGATSPVIKGIPNSFLAGGLAGAAELPGAIKTGNFAAPILAGLGAGLGQKFTSTAAAGFHAPASSLGQQVGNAFNSVTGGIFGPSSSAQGGSGIPQSGAGGATALTPSPSASSLAAFGGGVRPYTPNLSGVFASGAGAGGGLSLIPGVTGGNYAGTAGITNVRTPSLTSNTGITTPTNTAAGQASSSGTSKSLFDKLFSGDTGSTLLKTGAGLLAGQIGKPPEYNPDTLGTFDKASKYLQGINLPSVTNQQLNKYLTMSIPDIKNQLLTPSASNRALLEIDKKYQDALTQVQRMAANSGQSIETSSDARRQYDEINRQWAEARANLQAELEHTATTQAIGIHQWALEQSLQQGQFDIKSAMELAAMIGRDEELKAAIAQDNYEAFQNIIGELLSIGQGSSQQNNQQSQLSSVLGR